MEARFLTKARLLDKLEIEGKPVSFFSPPHDEPDFLWVDLEELASAFLPVDAAKRIVAHTRQFDFVGRPSEAAVNGDRIVMIVPHPLAQGFCAFLDKERGHIELNEDDWNLGPVNLTYTKAFSEAHKKFMPLVFDGIFAAYHNQGGPHMRGE